MPRKQLSTDGKPTLYILVRYAPLGSSVEKELRTGSPDNAVNQAANLIRAGANNVTIYYHNGSIWEVNQTETKKAQDKIKGGSNKAAAMYLTQFKEVHSLLIAENNRKEGATRSTTVLWIESFFECARALDIAPDYLSTAFDATYNLSDGEETEPETEPEEQLETV